MLKSSPRRFERGVVSEIFFVFAKKIESHRFVFSPKIVLKTDPEKGPFLWEKSRFCLKTHLSAFFIQILPKIEQTVDFRRIPKFVILATRARVPKNGPPKMSVFREKTRILQFAFYRFFDFFRKFAKKWSNFWKKVKFLAKYGLIRQMALFLLITRICEESTSSALPNSKNSHFSSFLTIFIKISRKIVKNFRDHFRKLAENEKPGTISGGRPPLFPKFEKGPLSTHGPKTFWTREIRGQIAESAKCKSTLFGVDFCRNFDEKRSKICPKNSKFYQKNRIQKKRSFFERRNRRFQKNWNAKKFSFLTNFHKKTEKI